MIPWRQKHTICMSFLDMCIYLVFSVYIYELYVNLSINLYLEVLYTAHVWVCLVPGMHTVSTRLSLTQKWPVWGYPYFIGVKGKPERDRDWPAMTKSAQNCDPRLSAVSVISLTTVSAKGETTGQELLFQVCVYFPWQFWCLSIPLSRILPVTLRKMHGDVLPWCRSCFSLVTSQMLRSSLKELPLPEFGGKRSQ